MYSSQLSAFGGRGFGRMVPGMLRMRFALPYALALSHAPNSNAFSISWGGGASTMPCSVQYYTGSAWATLAGANCGVSASALAVYLPAADAWKNNWGSTSIRLLRTTDNVVLGTFPQTLACAVIAGTPYETPGLDEDCDGRWNERVEGSAGPRTCSWATDNDEWCSCRESTINCGTCPASQQCYYVSAVKKTDPGFLNAYYTCATPGATWQGNNYAVCGGVPTLYY